MVRAIGATTQQKGSPVDAIICVATHSGGHLSHGLTSPMATLMRAIECHKRQEECFICPYYVPCKAHGMLDQCACSNHTDCTRHACWTSVLYI